MAESFFTRLRRGFGLWHKSSNAPESVNFRSDDLCKLNLSAFMGRRDAAFDSVGVIGSPAMLKCSDSERLAIYRQAMEQLERAIADCSCIAAAMSSTDSLRRERSFAGYLEAMRCHLNVMSDFVELGNQMMNGTVISGGLVEAPSSSEIAESGMVCHDAEMNFTGRFRNMVERVKPRVLRYREYARRSFSPENAERYDSSYNYYMKVYQLPVDGK